MILFIARADGRGFLEQKFVTVTVPTFVEYDRSVYSQFGVNVILRCVPNDTRAPVIWTG